MSVFTFKKFTVINERSAMKVNTDGVLLGAAMTIAPSDRRLLDIGTGTGTIALMAAQRLMAGRSDGYSPEQRESIRIDAIDIDEPSATEAASNFRNSPWNAILHAHHASLECFTACIPDSDSDPSDSSGGYDLIFSNPPYFDCSLQAPEERRNAARHTSTGLSYREILEFASRSLSETGRVSLVLPADQEVHVCRYARMSGLHLFRILRIRTVPRKAPGRIIVEFSRQRTAPVSDTTLTIQDGGQYTVEYLELMRGFYLFA